MIVILHSYIKVSNSKQLFQCCTKAYTSLLKKSYKMKSKTRDISYKSFHNNVFKRYPTRANQKIIPNCVFSEMYELIFSNLTFEELMKFRFTNSRNKELVRRYISQRTQVILSQLSLKQIENLVKIYPLFTAKVVLYLKSHFFTSINNLQSHYFKDNSKNWMLDIVSKIEFWSTFDEWARPHVSKAKYLKFNNLKINYKIEENVKFGVLEGLNFSNIFYDLQFDLFLSRIPEIKRLKLKFSKPELETMELEFLKKQHNQMIEFTYYSNLHVFKSLTLNNQICHFLKLNSQLQVFRTDIGFLSKYSNVLKYNLNVEKITVVIHTTNEFCSLIKNLKVLYNNRCFKECELKLNLFPWKTVGKLVNFQDSYFDFKSYIKKNYIVTKLSLSQCTTEELNQIYDLKQFKVLKIIRNGFENPLTNLQFVFLKQLSRINNVETIIYYHNFNKNLLKKYIDLRNQAVDLKPINVVLNYQLYTYSKQFTNAKINFMSKEQYLFLNKC